MVLTLDMTLEVACVWIPGDTVSSLVYFVSHWDLKTVWNFQTVGPRSSWHSCFKTSEFEAFCELRTHNSTIYCSCLLHSCHRLDSNSGCVHPFCLPCPFLTSICPWTLPARPETALIYSCLALCCHPRPHIRCFRSSCLKIFNLTYVYASAKFFLLSKLLPFPKHGISTLRSLKQIPPQLEVLLLFTLENSL